jgi:glutathione synthase/RimK-type ligase-like ATP-grasp enzyme
MGLNSSIIDYTKLPRLGTDDLLYNSARGSQTLESILLNDEVTTFHVKNTTLNQTYSTTDWSIIHEKANLPAPKTIFHLTADRLLLINYVGYLGGFPIIIKVAGGTRGIGTMKIDSWQNLVSTVDYLITTGDKFIMRQFIKAKSGCRMIVLGNEVIAAADFAMNENDFRNAVDAKQVKYFKRDYPESVIQTAIKATHLANTEFSGVDFLEDENGNFYLLEINFPTGFSGLINVCGVDIPLKMVEYLMNKAKQQ